MPTIDATVAGTGSNSYLTVLTANAYWADGVDEAEWNAYGEEAQQRALVSATRSIDNVCRGRAMERSKYDTTDPQQALVFPRAGDRDTDGTLEILTDIEDATSILALHLLRASAGASPISATGMQAEGVVSLSADGVSVTRSEGVWQSEWPLEVRRLVGKYVPRGGRVTLGRSAVRHWTEGWVAE